MTTTVEVPGTGVRISRAVFGTSRLGGTIERFDRRESLRILAAAAAAGVTTFDSADIYGQGNSERLIGEAFRDRRSEVVLSTKGGYVLRGKARLLSKIKPLVRRVLKHRPGMLKAAARARGSQMAQDFSEGHLVAALEASLTRLGTDVIDLYHLHSPDRQTLADGRAFEVLEGMRRAGRIRAYGASLLSWDDLPLCFDKGVSFVQLEADLLTGTGHRAALEAARQAGILVIGRQPFGSGLLARDPAGLTVDDFGGDNDRYQRAVGRIGSLRESGDPFATLLRYLTHHSDFPAFLFATTSLRHLEANLAAIQQPPLGKAVAAELASVFADAGSAD